MASRSITVLMLVVFASACATPQRMRLDTGQGEPLEHLPPTANRSVAVDEADFEQSLARLMLEEPLVVRPAGKGLVVRASFSPPAGDTSYWLGKALGGPCRPGQPRNECVSLLDDVMGLSQGEKLALGLGLSLQPMRESIARALEDTLTPQFFAAAIGAGMVSWVVLAANPEPVFTMGVSLASVAEVSMVAVVEGNLVISLAPTAVAMVASPSGVRSWGSPSGLRSALGPAGEGKEWHHLVEQTPGNVRRFGPHALHNTENVIALDKALHTQVSAFYSSIQQELIGSRTLTVRQWLSTRSFDEQRQFGLRAIENIRNGVWSVRK